ncbi:hypothetical protein [Candidatus Glomeribacter gigasporarum]|uniref:hypothetical protein n=1 Tax=Candidatus Glomeribacter gigasporarum TaxID=132144 RepID=UPI0013156888|nr:hypothetical protein [Candidatus Glomeribacter gigasporarum]
MTRTSFDLHRAPSLSAPPIRLAESGRPTIGRRKRAMTGYRNSKACPLMGYRIAV